MGGGRCSTASPSVRGRRVPDPARAAELIGRTVFGDRVTDLAPVPRLAGTPRVVVRARTVFGDLRLRSLAPGESPRRWRSLLDRLADRPDRPKP